tara:strand:- start:97 stop:294 length:198 start_codon:yes stop_codon:yes gene_type:complete
MDQIFLEEFLIIPKDTYIDLVNKVEINSLFIIFLFSCIASVTCCIKREKYKIINNEEIIEGKIIV